MRQKRLLIVEDEPVLASALETVLSREYLVEAVADAPAALAALDQGQYDLVLLDLILPRGTGVEVLSALCHSKSGHPPVLVMSALSGAVDLSQFQSVIAGQLSKPFGLEECRQRVRDALAGRAAAPPPAPVESRAAASVLLVDDDAEFLQGMAELLRRSGYAVVAVGTVDAALRSLTKGRYDAVVTDWIMPGATGLQLMQRIREVAPTVPMLLLTGYATPELSRYALSAGAADVLLKPFPPGALPVALEKALHQHEAASATTATATAPPAPRAAVRKATGGAVRYSLADIVGESPVMRHTRDRLIRAAAMDSVVLIQGETGTGKELFAQALHELSARAHAPFVAVNAAAIPENLLESELFGYAAGAFTGARKEGQKGRFLQAHGGTLFLDEIGDLPLALQVKLLRVLEEGEVDLIGGGTRQVDVRMVAATHRDLDRMVAEGAFRSDLFYRLNVVTLLLPPLRARTGDIPILVDRILSELQQRYGRPEIRISPTCFPVLEAYDWPGNIRELRNIVERAFAMANGSVILPSDLPATLVSRPAAAFAPQPATGVQDLASHEREAILRALEASGGNKVQAAKLLGISRAGLYIKLRIYGL